MSHGSQKRTPKRTVPSLDDWEREWRETWSKAGTAGYELPSSGSGVAETFFLTQVRSPEKETARLKRIQEEFISSFKGLYHLGRAVTDFGFARFKEDHPHYKLAWQVGAELAPGRLCTRSPVPTRRYPWMEA